MTVPVVLILGTKDSSELSDLVFSAGLTPILRDTMRAALGELRRQKFASVVVDYGKAEDDLLEFVLNVNDIDDSIRIFVANEDVQATEETWPSAPANVSFVTNRELAHKLAPTRIPLEPESDEDKDS
jgi:hypothetical protein